jgi:tRNA wybutosine-synthesizing protein 3
MANVRHATRFHEKKASILSELAVPHAEYTDKSPKGSIDEPIRDLIDLINDHEGWCTTSSCSGRVAVFVEGPKPTFDDNAGEVLTASKAKTSLGGKGGGRWLFVSHDPIDAGDIDQLNLGQRSKPVAVEKLPRLAHLSFSPLILHVLCASLEDAKPLLAAAINSGFRESGVQSLKALEGDRGTMVAIRTAGAAFSTVVGYLGDHDQFHRVVDDDCLRMCLRVIHERFLANDEKKIRLERALRDVIEKHPKHDKETKEERREWKRREGLARQQRQASTSEDTRHKLPSDADITIADNSLEL